MSDFAPIASEPRFGLVRAALLSVLDAQALRVDEPLVNTAVTLAGGSRVVADSRHKERAKVTMLRYLSRMGGRATPYGLFAGTALAEVAATRHLAVDDQRRHRVRVRVDAGVLERLLSNALEKTNPSGWPLRVAPSVAARGEVLRFARSGDASADVVSLRRTPAITAVLDLLGEGTRYGRELIAALSELAPATPPASLSGFVESLVHTGLLLRATDLIEPGIEPDDRALAILEGTGDTERAATLKALQAETCGIHPLDASLLPRLDGAWQAATKRVTELGDVPDHQRFHVDLELSMPDAAIDQDTVRDLTTVLSILDELFVPLDPLKEFRDAFRARYEDTEVPLLDALDLETGLLHSAERGLSAAAQLSGVRTRKGGNDRTEVAAVLLRALDRWQRVGGYLDLAELRSARRGDTRQAPVEAVHAALMDGDPGGYHSVLMAGHRRTSIALLARFALGREELAERLHEWVAAENDAPSPDGRPPIRAELVHNTGGRIGNVLIRPLLFEDVIALSGAAGGSLSLDRLRLSLMGEALRLRDSVTGRDVHIEVSTAHNVTSPGSDPIYTFLGQLRGTDGLAWSWGPLLRLPHLPRVVHGSVIVCPERWRLDRAAIDRLRSAGDMAAALREQLDGLASRRWVGVGVGDQLLPVDTFSARLTAAMLSRSFSADSLEITELPQVESPPVTGRAGRHVAEVIIPLVRTRRRQLPATPPAFDGAIRNTWVYAKYFTGAAAADPVVTRVQQLANMLRAEQAATGWFFVRHAENGQHVRARIRLSSPDSRGRVVAAMDRLGDELRRASLVTRVVMDDYVPEVARYGGRQIFPLAEELFVVDSDQVADIVRARPSEDVRLFHAVGDILHWVGVLIPDVADRLRLLQHCQRSLGLEFNNTGNPRGKYYRRHKERIERHLATAMPSETVTRRLAAFGDAVLAEAGRNGCGEAHAYPIFGSVLHMHCNRLFSVDSRRMEFLAQDLACRKIHEQLARGRTDRVSNSRPIARRDGRDAERHQTKWQ